MYASHRFISEVLNHVAKCFAESGCPLSDEQRAVVAQVQAECEAA